MIDVPGVMRASLAAKSIQNQIDARRAAYQLRVSEDERALRDEERSLAEKRAVLDQMAYQEELRAFQAWVAEVQRAVQARKRVLDEAFTTSMAEVRQEMISIVAEVAEERGLEVVLFKNQIVIAAKSSTSPKTCSDAWMRGFRVSRSVFRLWSKGKVSCRIRDFSRTQGRTDWPNWPR